MLSAELKNIEWCDETQSHMGALNIAWAILERELDNGVAVIFGNNPTLATCITANLGTMPKLDMLRSGIDMLKAVIGDELAREAIELLDAIADVTGKARTPLAHGRVMLVSDADGTGWCWTRQLARRKIRWDLYDPDHWRVMAVVVMEFARGWRRLASSLHALLVNASAEQIDDACSLPDVDFIVDIHARFRGGLAETRPVGEGLMTCKVKERD